MTGPATRRTPTSVDALVEGVLPHLHGVKGPGSTGNYDAKCPFHEDRTASFSISAKSGLWQCHAAGCGRRGNAFQLAEQFGLGTPSGEPAPATNWGLEGAMRKYGVTVHSRGVIFPIHDHSGRRCRSHVRMHDGEPRFQYWGRGKTLHALIDWERVREWGAGCGIAYIVEGNRDWLTLAAHGWPAIGILGTEHFARAREESFEHIKEAGIGALVITPDNDEPGRVAAFEWARTLHRDGFLVGTRMLPTEVNGRAVKDTFDLYRATGDEFEGWLHELPVRWRDEWG